MDTRRPTQSAQCQCWNQAGCHSTGRDSRDQTAALAAPPVQEGAIRGGVLVAVVGCRVSSARRVARLGRGSGDAGSRGTGDVAAVSTLLPNLGQGALKDAATRRGFLQGELEEPRPPPPAREPRVGRMSDGRAAAFVRELRGGNLWRERRSLVCERFCRQ